MMDIEELDVEEAQPYTPHVREVIICTRCGSDTAYREWNLCHSCRQELQKKADEARVKLRREHPDWFPQRI